MYEMSPLNKQFKTFTKSFIQREHLYCFARSYCISLLSESFMRAEAEADDRVEFLHVIYETPYF